MCSDNIVSNNDNIIRLAIRRPAFARIIENERKLKERGINFPF